MNFRIRIRISNDSLCKEKVVQIIKMNIYKNNGKKSRNMIDKSKIRC